jgi:hypothetical protein
MDGSPNGAVLAEAGDLCRIFEALMQSSSPETCCLSLKVKQLFASLSSRFM